MSPVEHGERFFVGLRQPEEFLVGEGFVPVPSDRVRSRGVVLQYPTDFTARQRGLLRSGNSSIRDAGVSFL
jgi:hypothetical protein